MNRYTFKDNILDSQPFKILSNTKAEAWAIFLSIKKKDWMNCDISNVEYNYGEKKEGEPFTKTWVEEQLNKMQEEIIKMNAQMAQVMHVPKPPSTMTRKEEVETKKYGNPIFQAAVEWREKRDIIEAAAGEIGAFAAGVRWRDTHPAVSQDKPDEGKDLRIQGLIAMTVEYAKCLSLAYEANEELREQLKAKPTTFTDDWMDGEREIPA